VYHALLHASLPMVPLWLDGFANISNAPTNGHLNIYFGWLLGDAIGNDSR
jgi:hypothetical protein